MPPESSAPPEQNNPPDFAGSKPRVIQPLNPNDPELLQATQTVVTPQPTPQTAFVQPGVNPAVSANPEPQPYTVPTLTGTPPGLIEQESKSSFGNNTDNIIIVLLVLLGGIGPGLVIAGLYILIKSLITKNGGMRLMAVGFITVGLVVSGAYYYFFVASKATSVQIGNAQVQLALPADTEVVEQKDDFVAYGVPTGKSDDTYAGQILFSKSQSVNVSKFEQAINSSEYQSLLQKQISTFCSGPQITEAKKIQIEGTQLAYQTAFKCSQQSDGSEYGGYVAEALSKAQITTIVVAAERKLFEAQSIQWDGVIPSIKITDN